MSQAIHNRKHQIYAAAERLFSAHGYHATTMRELARELQIEGGSLYSHISGKQELLYEIVLRASQHFVASAQQVVAHGDPSPHQLRVFMRQHLAFIADSIDHAVVYFHEWRHLGVEQQAVIKRHRDEYEAVLRGIIERGIASGEFAAGDARLISVQILSLLNWTYQWYDSAGAWNAEELADRFFEQVMCGLEPRS